VRAAAREISSADREVASLFLSLWLWLSFGFPSLGEFVDPLSIYTIESDRLTFACSNRSASSTLPSLVLRSLFFLSIKPRFRRHEGERFDLATLH